MVQASATPRLQEVKYPQITNQTIMMDVAVEIVYRELVPCLVLRERILKQPEVGLQLENTRQQI